MMSKLVRCCFCFRENDDDVEAITNSFTGTLHSYTKIICNTTNFEDMMSGMNNNKKSIVFYPINEDIVQRYSVNSLMTSYRFDNETP